MQIIFIRYILKKVSITNLLIVLFLFCSYSNYAQNFGEQLEQQYESYQEQHYTEKVYLHTDRDFYIAGEILWFSVYCTNAENQFSGLSKVVYVELLDKNKKAVVQQKIAVDNGQGSGSFYLPVSLNNAKYTLRAYSRWMRNTSADYFFHKPIAIANTFVGNAQEKESPKKLDIQFLPEGGQLLGNHQNKMAFKVTDAQGKGLPVKGVLLNSKKDTLLHFKDTHLGMGSFNFTPKIEEAYSAKLIIGQDTLTKDLPKAQDNGYILNVNIENEALQIVGISSYNEPFFTFFIHHNGKVLTSKTINTKDKKATHSIPLNELGTGVHHITLFNSKQESVAERLYFSFGKDKENIQIALPQTQTGSRQNFSFNLENLTENKARLSLSVFLNDSLQSADKVDIRTWLLLQSDLQGYVEKPQYYFSVPKEVAIKAIDALMLTQGWRKFKWEEILKPKPIENVFLPEIEGPVFEAFVYDKENGKPGNWVETYLSFPGKYFRFYAQKSSNKGKLTYVLRNVEGPQSGFMRAFTKEDSTWQFKLISPYDTNKSNLNYPPLILDPTLKNTLEQRSIGMQAQNIYLDKKLHQFQPLSQDSIPFYGQPDQQYLLDDYTRFPTMEEVMREYVPKVAVRKNKEKYRFKVFDVLDEIFFEGNPLMLLDGMPILSANKILAFDPFKIKSLDVVSRRFVSNKVEFKGIVSYRTYDGDYTWQAPHEEDFVFDYSGLQEKRIFYQPKYDTKENRNSKMPDFRTLLFWEPNIILNSGEIKEIQFFTSDKLGSFKGILQGLSQDGQPIFEQFDFTVEAVSN